MPNLFFTNKPFYFKQFNLAWVLSLIVKNIPILNYQTIQFSIRIDFFYTELNVKSVRY